MFKNLQIKTNCLCFYKKVEQEVVRDTISLDFSVLVGKTHGQRNRFLIHIQS